MCLRAHVSFVLADVPGPTPAARADRFSLAVDHKYHSIQKKKKERGRFICRSLFNSMNCELMEFEHQQFSEAD